MPILPTAGSGTHLQVQAYREKLEERLLPRKLEGSGVLVGENPSDYEGVDNTRCHQGIQSPHHNRAA